MNAQDWKFIDDDALADLSGDDRLPETVDVWNSPVSKPQLGLIRHMLEDRCAGNLVPLTAPAEAAEMWRQPKRIGFRKKPIEARTGSLVTWQRKGGDAATAQIKLQQTKFLILNFNSGSGEALLCMDRNLFPICLDMLAATDAPQPAVLYASLRWNYEAEFWMIQNRNLFITTAKLAAVLREVFETLLIRTAPEASLHALLSRIADVFPGADLNSALRTAATKTRLNSIGEAILLANAFRTAGFGKLLNCMYLPWFSPLQFVLWISGIDSRKTIFRSQRDVNEWKEILHRLDARHLHRTVQLLADEAAPPACLRAAQSILQFRLQQRF